MSGTENTKPRAKTLDLSQSTGFGLVAQIIEHSLGETFAAGNAVTEEYKTRAERAEAVLELVRDRISALLAGPWMPTTSVLRAAMYPVREEIDAWIANEKGTM